MEAGEKWAAVPGKANREGKATVFTDLFEIPVYAAQMVRALRPDLKATERDIQVISLRSVLMRHQYNDLGLLVKGVLILCAEAQSTWSVNVLVRLFLYLAETYHRYIQQHKELNIYGTKRIFLPIPYCCVVYTGREGNRPEELSLGQEFFGGGFPLDLRVRVLTEEGTGDIIQQYIRFSHVFDDEVKEHGYTRKAIEEAIRICRSEKVLEQYLEEREKEVRDIMMTLFSQEEATERYGYECREEGREEGRKEGHKEGRDSERVASIRNLMNSLEWTAQQAMDALKVPMQDRADLLARL